MLEDRLEGICRWGVDFVGSGATNHPLDTVLVMLTNMMLQEFAGSQVAHLHFTKCIIMRYSKLVCLGMSQPLRTWPASCEGVTESSEPGLKQGQGLKVRGMTKRVRHRGQTLFQTSNAKPFPSESTIMDGTKKRLLRLGPLEVLA